MDKKLITQEDGIRFQRVTIFLLSLSLNVFQVGWLFGELNFMESTFATIFNLSEVQTPLFYSLASAVGLFGCLNGALISG